MDKLLFKRILVSALTILALIYVAYLLISANFDMYPTENAVQTTVTNKIFTNAFIIRDENVIENNTSGVLSYSCYEGEEVKAGGEIAKIYETEEDALAQTSAAALEKQKNALESLQKNNSVNTVGIDTINNSIHNNLITYIDDINKGELNSALSASYNLLSSINQRQIYTGKYKTSILKLQAYSRKLTACVILRVKASVQSKPIRQATFLNTATDMKIQLSILMLTELNSVISKT